MVASRCEAGSLRLLAAKELIDRATHTNKATAIILKGVFKVFKLAWSKSVRAPKTKVRIGAVSLLCMAISSLLLRFI